VVCVAQSPLDGYPATEGRSVNEVKGKVGGVMGECNSLCRFSGSDLLFSTNLFAKTDFHWK
jgi:hypothetical protein